MVEEKRCSGPGHKPGVPCGRKVLADGLCGSHYRQKARGTDPLRPLRPQAPKGRGLQRLHGLRLSGEVIKKLDEEAERRRLPASTIASEVLERWAKRQGGKDGG